MARFHIFTQQIKGPGIQQFDSDGEPIGSLPATEPVGVDLDKVRTFHPRHGVDRITHQPRVGTRLVYDNNTAQPVLEDFATVTELFKPAKAPITTIANGKKKKQKALAAPVASPDEAVEDDDVSGT